MNALTKIHSFSGHRLVQVVTARVNKQLLTYLGRSSYFLSDLQWILSTYRLSHTTRYYPRLDPLATRDTVHVCFLDHHCHPENKKPHLVIGLELPK